MPSNRHATLWLLAVIAVLVAAAAPATSGDDSSEPLGPVAQSDVYEVTITGTEFAYEPNRIEVPLGRTVRIHFQNSGSITHSISIEALSLRTEAIQPGTTATLELTPDEVGTLAFQCTVSGHAMVGMTGEIVVTGDLVQGEEEETP